MNYKYKFKAYISYSHRDERWASWLHRALESYRVPHKLVGAKTGGGEVPARIRPVFRDRDDLSSASDLGGKVRQALSDSENMIVVCSPDAVASQWVNEEIREFASLGRENQIFCVIVAGEPDGGETGQVCFPPALAEIGLQEPLAADVRKWADGKHLSKLKLISGILGLSLDQLRRRDLQKRQKIWTLATVASLALAAVLIVAVTSRIAAQQRRNSGESLVAYKLNELRTLLNVADDPENLSRLKQWDQQELARLVDRAGVGKNALNRSALDLREQGNELYKNGALAKAMEKFQQSWALCAEDYRRDRNNQSSFFELGQAEFYIGLVYTDQGELEKAEESFMSYAEITRRLIVLQPKNAEWVLEMAYALTNLGEIQKQRDANNPERTLQLMQSALEYNQIALVLDPKNEYYQSELGQSHAFLADAQRGVCDLEGAFQSRKKNVWLEQNTLLEDSENTRKMQNLAWALSGYSVVQDEMGLIEGAAESLEQVLQLITPVLAQNPDVKKITMFMLHRRLRLAILKAYGGNMEQAESDLNALEEDWQRFMQDSGPEDTSTEEHAIFLVGRAWLAQATGAAEMAERNLAEAVAQLSISLQRMPDNRTAENMLMLAVFQRWELTREAPPEAILSLLPDYQASSGRIRACFDASIAARQAIMLGDTGQARQLTDYLLEHGYRDTGFIRVCKKYSLCSGQ
jgi:tetratricopeptide (TPR) repeat protein